MPNLNQVYAAQFPPYLNSFPLGGAFKPLVPFPAGIVPGTTQAATMANGNANIGVNNTAAFAVNGPSSLVQFSASVNGLQAGTNYSVVAIGSNYIQVATVQTGTPITPTGNAAVNVSVVTGQSNVAYVDGTQIPPGTLAAAGFTILGPPQPFTGPAIMVQPYSAVSNNQP